MLQRDVGSPTPLTLPGARRVTTQELHEIGPQSLLIDVLDESGNHKTIPSAVHLPGAGNYGRGHLKDGIQKSLSKLLAKLTGNDTGRQIVFFCLGAQCWESYNAALRAMDLGYRNVLWYRGGLEKSESMPDFPSWPRSAILSSEIDQAARANSSADRTSLLAEPADGVLRRLEVGIDRQRRL